QIARKVCGFAKAVADQSRSICHSGLLQVIGQAQAGTALNLPPETRCIRRFAALTGAPKGLILLPPEEERPEHGQDSLRYRPFLRLSRAAHPFRGVI
ncbi:MAG: hypothetical protein AAGK03_20895, partial [Pseudomonadota bacterium]